MKIVAIIILVSFLNSCVHNKTCTKNYIGTFSIDTNLINPEHKKTIHEKGWDTVRLVSDSAGNYQFNTNDEILKKSEGAWYTKSNDIEGNCIGYIKQKNLKQAISVSPFDVIIFINDTTSWRLPFRRVGKQQ